MRRPSLLALPMLLLLLPGCSDDGASPAPDPEPTPLVYEISVNGEAPRLDPGEEPAPGVVLYLGSYWIALGPPGAYRFRTERPDLYRETESGEWSRVGVRVRMEKKGKEWVLRNPLAGMTAAEIGALWSVEVMEPVEGLGKLLSAIDPERCVVRLWLSELDDWGRVPDLPSGLRHLAVFVGHEEGSLFGNPVPDLSPLRALTHLRWFRLEADTTPFDLDLLAGARELEHLELPEAKLLHPERLANFAGLRELSVDRSRIRDLTPLSGHRSLEVVDADGSRLERLPKGRLPALRELHVMGAEVSDAEVAAFRAANPRCRVFHVWDEMLAARLEGADRVRLIDGLATPRDKDRVVFEVSDAEEVRKLVSGLVFDNRRSGGGCLCVGYPALEFFAADRSLGRIACKHAYGVLELPDGLPGEGALTEEGAEHLVGWLVAHGYTDARKSRDEELASYAPARRRWKRYELLLPPRVLRSIEEDWDAEVLRNLAEEFPDARERARLYLRLLGVDEGSWSLTYGLDAKIVDVYLPSVGPKDLVAAIGDASGDAAILRGAGRWLLGERKCGTPDRAAFLEVLPAVARHALASPRRINRQRTMATLAEIGGPEARSLLSEVRAGRIEPRPLPAADAPEEDGEKTAWAEAQPESAATDAEYAGRRLDEMKK